VDEQFHTNTNLLRNKEEMQNAKEKQEESCVIAIVCYVGYEFDTDIGLE